MQGPLCRITNGFALTYNDIKDNKEFEVPPLSLITLVQIRNIINNGRRALRLEEQSSNGPFGGIEVERAVGKKRPPAKSKITEALSKPQKRSNT